jgi:hypothetical protein
MNKKYILLILLVFIIILAAALIYMSRSLWRDYQNKVKEALATESEEKEDILILEDIKYLPKPVQNYIRYTGAIGKEKEHNFSVVAEGQMKMNDKSGWAPLHINQYSFLSDHLIRLCYLNINVSGFPIYGLHSYTNQNARMHVKAAGLVNVVDTIGKEMRISDTITLLNDICMFAPAALIDERITWETIDDTSVKAIFTTDYCAVKATLYFNEAGELVNFVSDDRYSIENDGTYRKARWSTPFSDYREINGMKLAFYVEAIWNYPEGDDSYCRYTKIKELQYNCCVKE